MYYDSVQIRINTDGSWRVYHFQLDGDREPSKEYTPQNMGFFHYPRKWGIEKAFKLLKEHMIKCRQEEIDHLTKSINNLSSLSLPSKTVIINKINKKKLAKKLDKMADWSFYGNATIDMFPKNIQSAFKRFENHCTECDENYVSEEYSRSLNDIENGLNKWLDIKSDISWDGPPSDSTYLFAAMRYNVYKFIKNKEII